MRHLFLLLFILIIIVPKNKKENIQPVLAPNGTPIFRIERGGEVTFHGPGQLVVYPLLFLKNKPFKQDLHWYLRMVEEVIIQTLLHYDIKGVRDKINTGKYKNVLNELNFLHNLTILSFERGLGE